MTVKMKQPFAGSHISAVCADAVALAGKTKDSVSFLFNDTVVLVQPGELPADVEARWGRDYEANRKAYLESDEYKQAEAKREREYREKCDAVMLETAQSESQMREAKSPWPYTRKQLDEYVESLLSRDHDYGTCCYAMSLAATAAFNYVAHKLGPTGFQASCADLDFLRRSRHLEGPFMITKGEDLLYPQYDLFEKLREAIEGWQSWLKEQAAKNLTEIDCAHPDVIAHWKKIAATPVETDTTK